MARLTKIAAAIALTLATPLAMAEPVSVIGLIAEGLAAGGYISGITAAVITIGAGLLSSAEQRRKMRSQQSAARADYNASLQDRNVSGVSNEGSWKIVYGSPEPIGGDLVTILTSGDKDQYKHLVLVFAAHESQSVDEIYIEGEPLGPLDGNGWVQSGSKFYETQGDVTITEPLVIDSSGNVTTSHPVSGFLQLQDPIDPTANASGSLIAPNVVAVAGGTGAIGSTLMVTYNYTVTWPRVNCQKHLSPGGVDTADAFLIAMVPGKWTPAHKLSGYTYVVLTLDLNFGAFQGGPPNITAKIKGKKVYDWRTATTAYNNNVALCAADFLLNQYGMGASLAQVDSAAMIAAANACDSQGYTCDGRLDAANGRDANLSQLEDAMQGHAHFSGGVWRVIAGAWTSPVMALTDDTTLAGPIDVQQASSQSDQRFNGVRAQYVAAGSLGVAGDLPPYQVASYLAVDGYAKWKDMVFPFTQSASVCTKLAAIAVELSRLGLTILYPAKMACWRLQPGDRVTVTNAELGFVAKTFRVVEWSFDINSPVLLVLTEDAAAVWTGTFNVPDYQRVTSNLADPFARPSAPANVAAVSGTTILQRMGDGTIVTRVLVTWAAPTVRAILQGGYVQLQWRLATATDDRWQSQDLPPDAASNYLVGPQDRTNILVRVRFISGFGVQGAWSTILHYVVGKADPPTTPGYIAATQDTIFWGAVSDVDLAGYRVRAYPGSVDSTYWSRATPLHNDLLSTGPWKLTTTLYGLQTILLVAEDTTGNQSPAIFTTLDFGLPPSANAVQTLDYAALGFPGTYTNCSVVGGVLQASIDPSSDLFAMADLFAQPDLFATSYLDMTWVSQPFVPQFQGGTVSLASAAPGASVEYQIDGSALTDLFSAADLFAMADLFGSRSAFSPWPGAVGVNRLQGVIFRVTVPRGSQQGQVTAFAPSLVMPDVRQTFGNVAVPSAGLRLAPTGGVPSRAWIAIKTAQITPVVDGAGAIGGRILDFSPSLGPLIQLVDGTGTAVSGRATIDIGGLADV